VLEEGSVWTEKKGPLPVWAWAGLGLGGAVLYASWKRNKAASDSSSSDDSGDVTAHDVNGNSALQPTYAFVDADTTNVTVQAAPPGGGRPPTPMPLPAPVTGVKPTGPIVKPLPKPSAPSVPKPTPAPAAPKGQYVTVTKWNAKSPPWNSTLWGIATHVLGPKANWKTVWNAPQNAALRKKRNNDPTKIQPGDKVWVPK
jgi:hypothetical protein